MGRVVAIAVVCSWISACAWRYPPKGPERLEPEGKHPTVERLRELMEGRK